MTIPRTLHASVTGYRIHTTPTTNLCRRCGITITWDRHHRYNGTCGDCSPYYGIKRTK